MKHPRIGDYVAIPLPNGRFARARLLDRAGRVASVALLAQPQNLLLRVLDRAIVEGRWPNLGGYANRAPTQADVGSVGRWPLSVDAAERFAQAFLFEQGSPETYALRIRLLRRIDGVVLGALRDDAIIAWRHRLDTGERDAVGERLTEHPRTTICLRAAAAHDASAIAELAPHLAHLSIDVAGLVEFPFAHCQRLRSLQLFGAPGAELNLAPLAQLANLHALEIVGVKLRGLESLSRIPSLRILDLRNVTLAASGEMHLTVAQLEALRLRGITILDRLDFLDGCENLRSLALLDLLALRDFAPLARHPALRSLELRGLWQMERTDFTWLARSRLDALTLEIGSRRQATEVRLARPLPQATPFELLRQRALLCAPAAS